MKVSLDTFYALQWYFDFSSSMCCHIDWTSSTCLFLLHEQHQLASPSPGPPDTSEWLTGLWDVHLGGEVSSPTCCSLVGLPHLCPSCSCVWHTTSSPSPPSRSGSASWWASSATFLLSPQTPWRTAALGIRGINPPLLPRQLVGGYVMVFSFAHVVSLWQDKLGTHSLMSRRNNSGWDLPRTRTAVRQGSDTQT